MSATVKARGVYRRTKDRYDLEINTTKHNFVQDRKWLVQAHPEYDQRRQSEYLMELNPIQARHESAKLRDKMVQKQITKTLAKKHLRR